MFRALKSRRDDALSALSTAGQRGGGTPSDANVATIDTEGWRWYRNRAMRVLGCLLEAKDPQGEHDHV